MDIHVTTVYLDTNKWIELARAHYRRDSSAAHILAHLKSRVDQQKLTLPLSITHKDELLGHSDPRKRRELWEFAVSMSRCVGIKSRQVVLPVLIERAVAKVLNVDCIQAEPEIFTSSGLFGLKQERFLSESMERALRTQSGWRDFWLQVPESTRIEIEESSNKREREFMARRNKLRQELRLDSPELRRRLYLAILMLSEHKIYKELLLLYGSSFDDSALCMEDRTRLVTEVSPLDVEAALVTQSQQQWDRQEQQSDPRDVFHLSMALPFCDVVITERYWVDLIRREKLDRKYNTRVDNNLSILLDY